MQAFYSLKDTKTPAWAAFIAFIANLIFSLILMGPLKHGGLALATTLSSLVNLGILIWFLRKKLGRIGLREVSISILKISLASIIMGLGLYWLVMRDGSAIKEFISRVSIGYQDAIILAISVTLGMGIFFIASYVLKAQELDSFLDIIKRSKGQE